MYTKFYNLKEKPFNLTPSSRSLYLGNIHKEALALLTYGVMDRKGFILLTGEVGTGKTTMVHALLSNLGKDIQYVYLSNPLFSVKDFMNYLAYSAFKKKMNFENKTDFLIQFEAFLKEQSRNQKNFTLIIDEAQKLSFELLEEIRLLSNMETAEEKLINIFLVGQPELNEILNQPRCRPLLQRISIRYHIKTLDESGTLEYISTRLKLSGAENPDAVISRSVARAIFRYSDGYPRMINVLADNVLLLGYSRDVKQLTASMVKECYDDLQLEGSVFDAGKGKDPMKNKRGLLERICSFKWAAL
jgi:general secretion pathway protein A